MFKRKEKQLSYEKENEKPVLKCSICTGEQVAGFKNIHTGAIREIMLIKDNRDLETFKSLYGLTDVTKEY